MKERKNASLPKKIANVIVREHMGLNEEADEYGSSWYSAAEVQEEVKEMAKLIKRVLRSHTAGK